MCISLQHYQFCVMEGKYIKEQCVLFLTKINVCLFSPTPAFIYSPNWMSEKGVSVKCHPNVIFFFMLSKIEYNIFVILVLKNVTQNNIFVVQRWHNLMHQKENLKVSHVYFP